MKNVAVLKISIEVKQSVEIVEEITEFCVMYWVTVTRDIGHVILGQVGLHKYDKTGVFKLAS